MGRVYLAKTPWPDTPLVALKVLHEEASRSESFIKRFKHEMEIAVRMRHRSIVRALDVGSIDNRFYVAAELVVGADVLQLAVKLANRGVGAPITVVVWVLAELLDALAYVHNAEDDDGPLRLIHRDVTPGNVLFDFDGFVKLADFGLAKSKLTDHAELTATFTVLGTPSFLPPEAFQGQQTSQALDVYGAGAVAYVLLTGLPPYWGNFEEIFRAMESRPPYPLAELRPDLPHWLVRIIESLMAKNPKDRPDLLGFSNTFLKLAQNERVMVNRSQIREWLQEVFHEEYTQKIIELQQANKIPSAQSDMSSVKRLVHTDPDNVLYSAAMAFDEATVIGQVDESNLAFKERFAPKPLHSPEVILSPEILGELGEGKSDDGIAASISAALQSKQPPPLPKKSAVFEPDVMFADPPDEPEEDPEDAQEGHSADDLEPSMPTRILDSPTVSTEFPSPSSRTRRSALKVLALLAVVGVGLGGLLIHNRPMSLRDKLQQRLLSVQTEINRRNDVGQPVDAKTLRRSLNVVDALFREDYETAEQLLEFLEEQLNLPTK